MYAISRLSWHGGSLCYVCETIPELDGTLPDVLQGILAAHAGNLYLDSVI